MYTVDLLSIHNILCTSVDYTKPRWAVQQAKMPTGQVG